jgi:hypothetical protein
LSGNVACINSNAGGISTTNSPLEAVGTEMRDALFEIKRTEFEVNPNVRKHWT